MSLLQEGPLNSIPTQDWFVNNILGLWKISQQTIGTKKLEEKDTQPHPREKYQGFMWFDNSLCLRAIVDEFTILKRDYKVFTHLKN